MIATYVELIEAIEFILEARIDDDLKCRSIKILIKDARSEADDVIEAATGDGRR